MQVSIKVEILKSSSNLRLVLVGGIREYALYQLGLLVKTLEITFTTFCKKKDKKMQQIFLFLFFKL